ncbi:hypothetical protein K438DRAFT_590370 [Mycena galopus ATCC 62051]|nr:hypothetical protein K438DRAFT_590370 [Mycena galopus ATCC 62051]
MNVRTLPCTHPATRLPARIGMCLCGDHVPARACADVPHRTRTIDLPPSRRQARQLPHARRRTQPPHARHHAHVAAYSSPHARRCTVLPPHTSPRAHRCTHVAAHTAMHPHARAHVAARNSPHTRHRAHVALRTSLRVVPPSPHARTSKGSQPYLRVRTRTPKRDVLRTRPRRMSAVEVRNVRTRGPSRSWSPEKKEKN